MEKNIFIIGVLAVALFFIGFLITPAEVDISFILIVGLLAFFLTFINLKLGLFILIFMIPLSTQFRLGVVGKGPIEIATDDIIVLSIILGWLGYLALTKQPLFKKSPLNLPFLGYFMVSLISLVPAATHLPQNVLLICFLHILKWSEYIIIYFIVISTIKTKEELKFYTFTFMTSCIFVGISHLAITISKYLTNPSLPGREILSVVPFGFDSNGIAAAYYLFFLSIILAFVLTMAKGTFKFFWVCASLLISFTLFTSFCRAAYLGIIVASFILVFLSGKKFIAIILIMAILTPIILIPAVGKRIAITATARGDNIELDLSAQERLIIWQIALKKIKEVPLLGIGFWTARYSDLFGFTTSHNQYLTVLLETGILGFIFFFLIFFRIFNTAVFTYRKSTDPFIKSLNIGYIAGLVGILIQSIFGEAFESVRITGPIWFMTGIIVLTNLFLKEDLKEGT